MCEYDDEPYIPNEYTMAIPGPVWRKLNQGIPMTEARDPLLQEREKTHGSFDHNAEIWQKLHHMFAFVNFVNDSQRLATSMIFLKLARMSQNPTIKDHFDDIAGYARLASEACDK